MNQRDVEDILRLGQETRSFEAKSPGDLDNKHYVARVVRADMAMGNLRDGGQICLGIDDKRIAQMEPGLTDTQVEEWTNFDNVCDKLAKYSDPPVSFHLNRLTVGSGSEVVVLEVEEFESDLHICKKDHPNVLQAGQTYVRPRGKPQSTQVPSLVDMRDLHNLAIDKGVREFVRRSEYAQSPLTHTGSPTPEEADKAAFDREGVDAWETKSSVDIPAGDALVAGVVTPAYFNVSVRPGPYESTRISPDQLETFAATHAVRLRGWPLPMVSNRERVFRHPTWVGQDLQAAYVPHVEAWRLFSSGHFLQRRVLATDLNDAADLRSNTPGATGAVALWDVLLYLVELAELGARYATTLKVDTVTIEVSLENITDRELISGDFQRELHGPYVTAAASLTAEVAVATPALLASPRAVGVRLTQQVLRKFGLTIADKVLTEWQDSILEQVSRPF